MAVIISPSYFHAFSQLGGIYRPDTEALVILSARSVLCVPYLAALVGRDAHNSV